MAKPRFKPQDIQELRNQGWELAGYIGVDAGLVMIGDPCYASATAAEQHPIHNWGQFCSSLGTEHPTVKSLRYSRGHEGLGVVIGSGCGDGFYPVMVRKATLEGFGERIVEARVLFEYEDSSVDDNETPIDDEVAA